ncbi:MAG: DUF3108 domain-containing protein [Nitrospirae bacterium]|nr:DUF3108 domain-containing protein [Nitrospirota bacterium]
MAVNERNTEVKHQESETGTRNERQKVIACLAFSVVYCLFSVFVSSADCFPIPEHLRYDLTWSGIKTGDAVLEVKQRGENIQLISKANTSPWASLFFLVDDTVVSTIRKRKDNSSAGFIGVPLNYRIKIHEGRQQRDKEFIMDHVSKKVAYINYLTNDKKEFGINEFTLDPLSTFYFIRTLSLEVGNSVFIDVFDSEKLYKAEVKVLKKEVLETPAGKFNTVLIKPIIRSEGIFFRKGDIFIWLTDDNRKVPVMMKTRIAVGTVKAILVGGL